MKQNNVIKLIYLNPKASSTVIVKKIQMWVNLNFGCGPTLVRKITENTIPIILFTSTFLHCSR